MSAQKTLHKIEIAIASCSRHLLFASLALMFLPFQLHAQTFIHPRPLTAQQQWNAQQAYQQQQRQYEIKKQQQELQGQIDNLNSDILSKSNVLQKLLSPTGSLYLNPYRLSFSERTNIAERLKELPEQGKKRFLKEQDPWRKVDGKTVLVSGASGFKGYTGKILQTTTGGILFQSYMSLDLQNIFIKNFPYVYADGTEIPSILAVPCEPYSYTTVLGGSVTVNAADYGTPCSPPPDAEEIEAAVFRVTPADESAIKKDADFALAEITKAQTELNTARKNLRDFLQKLEDEKQAVLKAQEQKKKEVQDRVLKSNQDLADNGDAYGLLRMGERYRDGDGVEKDLAKAKDYLTKAAAAGSPSATDELSKLNQVSTNSPAMQ